jgi:hypothetical protein
MRYLIALLLCTTIVIGSTIEAIAPKNVIAGTDVEVEINKEIELKGSYNCGECICLDPQISWYDLTSDKQLSNGTSNVKVSFSEAGKYELEFRVISNCVNGSDRLTVTVTKPKLKLELSELPDLGVDNLVVGTLLVCFGAIIIVYCFVNSSSPKPKLKLGKYEKSYGARRKVIHTTEDLHKFYREKGLI